MFFSTDDVRLTQEHQWSCRNCGCAYELAAIEAQLLRAVRLRARAYQLQDLRCLKCRQVRFKSKCHLLNAAADVPLPGKFPVRGISHIMRTAAWVTCPG